MRRHLCVLLPALLVIGCSSGPEIQSTSRLTLVEGDAVLPAPNRSDLGAPDRISLIGPLDTIEVKIFGVPELSGQMQVDGGGRIAMPLIGTLGLAVGAAIVGAGWLTTVRGLLRSARQGHAGRPRVA